MAPRSLGPQWAVQMVSVGDGLHGPCGAQRSCCFSLKVFAEPRRGIRNRSADCHLITALQCVSEIEPLWTLLASMQAKPGIANADKYISAVRDAFLRLYHFGPNNTLKDRPVDSVGDVLKALSALRSEFQNAAVHQDCGEVLFFLIDLVNECALDTTRQELARLLTVCENHSFKLHGRVHSCLNVFYSQMTAVCEVEWRCPDCEAAGTEQPMRATRTQVFPGSLFIPVPKPVPDRAPEPLDIHELLRSTFAGATEIPGVGDCAHIECPVCDKVMFYLRMC